MSIHFIDLVPLLQYLAVAIFIIIAIVTIRSLRVQHRKDKTRLRKEMKKVLHKLDEQQYKADHSV